MTRSRASAKKAGAWFERSIADYLATWIDDRIDKRPRYGAKDRGDIGGLRTNAGHRIVGECKYETTGLNLGAWQREAEVERGNDDAIACVIFHKRHGKAHPGDQWVTTTVDDLIAIRTGVRPTRDDA